MVAIPGGGSRREPRRVPQALFAIGILKPPTSSCGLFISWLVMQMSEWKGGRSWLWKTHQQRLSTRQH